MSSSIRFCISYDGSKITTFIVYVTLTVQGGQSVKTVVSVCLVSGDSKKYNRAIVQETFL